jgi:HEPN domain-containing protein
MPHDPERIAEVRSWFARAESDLRAAKISRTPEPLLRRAAHLSECAWRYRYPGEPEEPTSAEAEEALEIAQEVFQTMLGHLPEEMRS